MAPRDVGEHKLRPGRLLRVVVCEKAGDGLIEHRDRIAASRELRLREGEQEVWTRRITGLGEIEGGGEEAGCRIEHVERECPLARATKSVPGLVGQRTFLEPGRTGVLERRPVVVRK